VSLAKAAPNLVREGAQLFRGTEDMESAAALTRQVGEGEGGAAQDLKVTGSCNSFSAGTLVLMADGSRKPIEDVQPGDLVMAEDPITGLEAAEPVQATIIGHGLKHLYDISVDGQVIEATYNHPFWVVEK
jgi:hypothetical protein